MKKTVVITGATDGIGKALAILLSKEYNLALCGRNEDKMKQLVQELDDCIVYAECFDITDDEKRHNFCEYVKNQFSTVDVLVNNAGANTKKDKIKDISLVGIDPHEKDKSTNKFLYAFLYAITIGSVLSVI